MRANWKTVGAGVAAGLIALVAVVTWTKIITAISGLMKALGEGAPYELGVQGVSAGPISSYSDLKMLTEYQKYHHKPDIVAAQISVTLNADLRHMAMTGFWSYEDVSAVPCGCNRTGTHRQSERCAIGIAPIFDGEGFISVHNRFLKTSRRSPAETVVPYRIYIGLTPLDPENSKYDLVKKPVDLCVQFVRKSALAPPRQSNVIRIPKEVLAAAITRGHAPEKVEKVPNHADISRQSLPPFPLTNPLEPEKAPDELPPVPGMVEKQ